jgi:hypothetical protein
LRRQGAGDQRHRIGEPCLQCLSEDIDAFRQLNAIYPELNVRMVAADMQLAE